MTYLRDFDYHLVTNISYKHCSLTNDVYEDDLLFFINDGNLCVRNIRSGDISFLLLEEKEQYLFSVARACKL